MVHPPRIRGEHDGSGTRCVKSPCSPPHMQGIHPGPGLWSAQRRFTPACAGNTSARSWPRRSWPVDPRVRGEHEDFLANGGTPGGSPPRMRGMPARRYRDRRCARFTPSACGGYLDLDFGLEGVQGSPPRARGIPGGDSGTGRPSRFTPTCAGNTPKALGVAPFRRVHPRVRGEHKICGWHSWPLFGLPPLARGTYWHNRRHGRHARSTPAHAGNTRCSPCPRRA